MTAPQIILTIVALVVAAIAIEAYVKRNRRQPLSKSRPSPRVMTEKVELGQEATDLDMVEKAHAKNQRTEKFNDATTRRRKK